MEFCSFFKRRIPNKTVKSLMVKSTKCKTILCWHFCISFSLYYYYKWGENVKKKNSHKLKFYANFFLKDAKLYETKILALVLQSNLHSTLSSPFFTA